MSSEIQLECDKEVYEPGETICGRVMWFCTKAPDAIKIDLKWRTSGRGTTDKGKAHSVKVSCSAAKGDASFQLEIPKDCPPSYSGSLVSIIWSIDCRADIPWAVDPKISQDIIVSKTGSAFSPPPEYRGED